MKKGRQIADLCLTGLFPYPPYGYIIYSTYELNPYRSGVKRL